MAKINLLALGGLNEKQRRLYILDIDSKIFILDSGVYEPLNNNFGIQHFVPNIEYLRLNKDKIKGIFLSSANRMNIGSLQQIIKLKDDIEIYGSKSTLDSLDVFFKMKTSDWNKKVIKRKETINVENIEMKAIALPSIIPGTFGYQFKTSDGNILYFTDYVFDSINEYNISLIEEIAFLTQEKNLLLISDSSLSTEKNSLSSQVRIIETMEKYFKKENRFVISIYEDEILNVVELIELCKKYNKKLFLKSNTLFELISIFMKNDEIESFPIKKYLEYDEKNDEKDSVVILSGTRTKLYKTIDLIVDAHNKKDFVFEENDIVYFAALPQAGNEHIFANVTNKIMRINLNFLKPIKDQKKIFGTTSFDIRNVINLIKPTFFMPVSAYYTQLNAAREIAIKNEVIEKNIFVGDNGEIFTILNGISKGKTHEIAEINSKVIESIDETSIDNELIEERKSIGKDGVATISFILNKENKIICSDIDIQMKGVVISAGQENVLEEIKDLIIRTSDELFEKRTLISKSTPLLKKTIGKIFRINFNKVPQLIFNIMEI